MAGFVFAAVFERQARHQHHCPYLGRKLSVFSILCPYHGLLVLASVGQYAIQVAKLQSLKVITTCSPRNFDLIKALGADHVLDYHSSTVIEDIKCIEGNLRYVFDTIGDKTSSSLSSSAASKGATFCTVRPGKANTENLSSDIHITDVLVWTAFLWPHSYGEFHWPVSIHP